MSDQDICFLSAIELENLIRKKELSAREVMQTHLEQIERVNPKVNAIVTFLPEQAIEQAKAADAVSLYFDYRELTNIVRVLVNKLF